MNRPIVNVDEMACGLWGREVRGEARIYAMGESLGARQLGYNLVVLPPGKRAFPFHNHRVNEEMFFVLEGEGEVRIGDGRYPIRPGDAISCPSGGRETAHQILNTSRSDLKYLAVSTALAPEVAEYPESGKLGFVAESNEARLRVSEIVNRTQAEDPRELVEGAADLDEELRVGKIFRRHSISVVLFDPCGEPIPERFVEKDVRPHRRALLVAHGDPEAQTCRAAAVVHGSVHVDVVDGLDGVVVGDDAFEKGASVGVFERLDGRDDRHLAARQGDDLRIERVAPDGLARREFRLLREDDVKRLPESPPELGDEVAMMRERMLVEHEKALVRDGEHIGVERALIDPVTVLLPGEHHGFRKRVAARHRGARFARLSSWKEAPVRVRIEPRATPREQVYDSRIRCEPRVISGALVGKVRAGGERFVNREAPLVGEDRAERR